MYKIRIDKDISEDRPFDLGYFGVYVDRLLNRTTTSFLRVDKKHGSFRDVRKGVLGARVKNMK